VSALALFLRGGDVGEKEDREKKNARLNRTKDRTIKAAAHTYLEAKATLRKPHLPMRPINAEAGSDGKSSPLLSKKNPGVHTTDASAANTLQFMRSCMTVDHCGRRQDKRMESATRHLATTSTVLILGGVSALQAQCPALRRVYTKRAGIPPESSRSTFFPRHRRQTFARFRANLSRNRATVRSRRLSRPCKRYKEQSIALWSLLDDRGHHSSAHRSPALAQGEAKSLMHHDWTDELKTPRACARERWGGWMGTHQNLLKKSRRTSGELARNARGGRVVRSQHSEEDEWNCERVHGAQRRGNGWSFFLIPRRKETRRRTRNPNPTKS